MAVRYYVGTSGFSYPHWRGIFYPPKLAQARWLEHYAREFPTVELNASFYRLPSEKSFQGWRERTPAGFRFAVKASRLITHLHRLHAVEQPLDAFVGRARRLQDKLGPLLYQLPPSMQRDERLLESFLSLLPQDAQHVLEFRHPSWYEASVLALLRKYGVAFCVHDMRRRESPVVATAAFAYLRFHGTAGRYAGGYSQEQLSEWARRIRHLGEGVHAVYAYFNNDIGGHAIHDAKALTRLLA